jgi:hypothetical protein
VSNGMLGATQHIHTSAFSDGADREIVWRAEHSVVSLCAALDRNGWTEATTLFVTGDGLELHRESNSGRIKRVDIREMILFDDRIAQCCFKAYSACLQMFIEYSKCCLSP